uniref:Uncharacterized protein n=1 Tax=Chromera velia CCMP2878 TaxID=1169474 RepID=A0A0G4HIU3_9ALVE|eukprot:Cvel_1089.t1-p1 / transcript=Cvel_1089.t1 / gene=Cvel_1089 / organism=Chromera_velia_CCMP2878 / gene_product=Ribonuclease inhibitor, putative / transcript_product=Ribonuclease inhibitor, putative / location=Cvel_scaffold35:92279-97483(-) / protein_length=935 / sequence_SO=supercontig / SO=protein_coding / is_pseudo=false
MAQPVSKFRGDAPEEELGAQGTGAHSVYHEDAVLSAAFGHTLPTAEHISALCSKREGFGLGCVLLHFMRTGRSPLALRSLDLSGPGVCTPTSLPVLAAFFQRLKPGGGGGGGAGAPLKTLLAHKCDLDDFTIFFQSLPPSLECLDLRENGLRRPSMESFSFVLTAGWLPTLLSLDLSDNPLGPFGVMALAKGLCAPLQSLQLARTDARKEGVGALAEVLKAKKVSSLQTLDLAENEMRAGGFKPLSAALCEPDAVPSLRVLMLKKNRLTEVEAGETQRDYAPLSALLSTDRLTELVELDLSENDLFDERLGVEGVPDRPSAAAVVTGGRFPKLRVLNLAGNDMYSQEAAAFANALGEGGAPLLEDLDLSENGQVAVGEDGELEGEAGGIQALADAVSAGRVSHLTRLRLNEFYDLPNDSVRSLFQAMADGKTPDLRTIEVRVPSSDDLERYDEAVDAFAVMVREGSVRKIEKILLDFYYGDLRSAPVSSLGRALGSGGASSLRELKLKWFCPWDDENPDGGVVGLAEGLGGGGMPLLEDLDLDVSFADDDGGGEGEGGAELGEVLSMGKVPSLRRVRLGWPATQLLSTLCEGLCVGSSPHPMMRLEMDLKDVTSNSAIPLSRFARAIRSGRVSYLQKLSSEWHSTLMQRSAEELGGALTHSGAGMAVLEEICIPFSHQPTEEAFFEALHRGPGRLPSLRKLPVLDGQAASCLSPLIKRGQVPSLSEVKLKLSKTNVQGIQAVAMSLGSPHAASLRKMEVQFGEFAHSDTPNLATKFTTFCVSLASDSLSKLRTLSVENVPGVLSLCAGLENGKLSSLSDLTLISVRLETEAEPLSAVLHRENLPRLSTLRLICCSLTDEGFKALTDAWKSRPPPPLQSLDLTGNNLSDGGAKTLADLLGSRRIPSLSKVNIRNNREIQGLAKEMLKTTYPESVLC